MHRKSGLEAFILALAFLVGAAMTPGVVHAQDQSSTTTNGQSTTTKAKNKTKNAANSTKSAASGAASQTGSAASTAKDQTGKAANSTKNATSNAANSAKTTTTNGANSAKNGVTSGANTTKNAAGAATPPSPGMVWVNTNTKMYHKSGSQYYGKTKSGKWMTESDAQKAGYKAASN